LKAVALLIARDARAFVVQPLPHTASIARMVFLFTFAVQIQTVLTLPGVVHQSPAGDAPPPMRSPEQTAGLGAGTVMTGSPVSIQPGSIMSDSTHGGPAGGGSALILQMPPIMDQPGGQVVHAPGFVAPLMHVQPGYHPDVPAGHSKQFAVPAGFPFAHVQLLITTVPPGTHEVPEQT
jgi:hypothetical protein